MPTASSSSSIRTCWKETCEASKFEIQSEICARSRWSKDRYLLLGCDELECGNIELIKREQRSHGRRESGDMHTQY